MDPITLLSLVAGIMELVPKALSIAEQLHRDGQMTDAEWEAFKAKHEALMAAPHWQPKP